MKRTLSFISGIVAFGLLTGPALAGDLPGTGITVQPLQSSIAEERFQTVIVNRAMEALGYTVLPIKEIEYATAFVAIAKGDATYMANHWDPLQQKFFENAGGEETLYRAGTYVPNGLQGYLADKKTADAAGITNLAQLSDPDKAALFDANGDGTADLAGCNPGWGCERAIEEHLTSFGLRKTVTHNQGSYAAIIADTITRYRQGDSILYYTWTPYWVSGELVPGKDVIWLQVPNGGRDGIVTALPDGSNYGFKVNDQRIVANRAFVEANPAVGKLFSVMNVSSNDVSSQNLRMRQGEKKPADIDRHADAWIRAHQSLFDGWVAQALMAAN